MDEAFGILCLSISPEMLFHVESCSTPNEVWKLLERLFGKQDEIWQSFLFSLGHFDEDISHAPVDELVTKFPSPLIDECADETSNQHSDDDESLPVTPVRPPIVEHRDHTSARSSEDSRPRSTQKWGSMSDILDDPASIPLFEEDPQALLAMEPSMPMHAYMLHGSDPQEKFEKGHAWRASSPLELVLVDWIVPVDWILVLYEENRHLEAGDGRLPDGYGLEEMKRLLQIGLLCSLNDPSVRPTTKWIIQAMDGDVDVPALPSFKALPYYASLSSESLESLSTLTQSNKEKLWSGSGKVHSPTSNIDSATSIRSTPTDYAQLVDTPQEFTLREIIAATESFGEGNMVAEMDFGTAYRGVLRDSNVRILVKRQGMKTCPALRARFAHELSNLGRLRHQYLVQLQGWCTEKGEILVLYDYLMNRSLSKMLCHKKGFVLDWPSRYKIAKGLSASLLYLHEECEQQVIHWDVKASNIMLDLDYNARLGDFGLARLIEHNRRSMSLPGVAGTVGYIAQECLYTGRATAEADVFSFGAVILEVISGRHPVEECDISEESKDFVDILLSLQGQDQLSQKSLMGIMTDVLLIGMDITSSVIEWAMAELIRSPRALTKLKEEIDNVVDDGRLVDESDISQIPYLESVAKETLRLHPPAPMTDPTINSANLPQFQSICPVDGDGSKAVALDKGSETNFDAPIFKDIRDGNGVLESEQKYFKSRSFDWVFCLWYSMARMESIWGADCRDFKPERWLHNGKFVTKSEFIYPVFNEGPRRRPGRDVAHLQMKWVASSIILRFRVKAVVGHPVVPKYGMMLRMKLGLKVTVLPR